MDSLTRFSVNLNKFALLRDARGTNQPDLLAIARRCLAAGVHGITVHPRTDQRHVKYGDVADLDRLVRGHPGVEFNVEGTIDETLLDIVEQVRPAQCTLVPDAPDQLTSDHGWDVGKHEAELRKAVARLHRKGIRVSLFVDPEPRQAAAARAVGADRVELYTHGFAAAYGTADQPAVTASFRDTAVAAQRSGLGVNAGHDLSLRNLGHLLQEVPNILEVSIGHAFVCECFDFGLEGTIARYLEIIERRAQASRHEADHLSEL
jgi:pyridoxine 5-phosphate synthase